MKVLRLSPAEARERMTEAMSVYAEAMGYPPEAGQHRAGFAIAHTRRPAFRAVVALGDGDGLGAPGELLGFGYGYAAAPGQWWHDQVRAAIPAAHRAEWLTDCFEVVELHVRPPAQGHGLGASQLRALLAMTPAQTTLLSTPEADEQASRAWRLYRRFEFVDVLRHFYFPGDERPFAILGRHLP